MIYLPYEEMSRIVKPIQRKFKERARILGTERTQGERLLGQTQS